MLDPNGKEAKEIDRALALVEAMLGYEPVGEADGEEVGQNKAPHVRTHLKAVLGEGSVDRANRAISKCAYGTAYLASSERDYEDIALGTIRYISGNMAALESAILRRRQEREADAMGVQA